VLRLLLYINRFDETDANLIAIDPSQLATLVCFPMDEAQGKTLSGEDPRRAADGQLSARLRNILYCARTLPRTIDRHHVRGEPALKYDTMCLAVFHLIKSSKQK
jgi:hypothetical protein